jgi:phage tail sheath protein FI
VNHAEYLSPGVYVEEIDAGPKPIEGVSTSTAGAAGIHAFRPTSGKPELVTSFADFVRSLAASCRIQTIALQPMGQQTRSMEGIGGNSHLQ